jgi:hypothetical protein
MSMVSMRVLMLASLLGAAGAQALPLQVEPLAFATGERAAQPSVAVEPREGFVVTWQERAADHNRLLYALIDRDGVEQRRGTIATGSDWFVNGADFPSLAVLDNGDWVSFFLQKSSPETYSYDIHMVRSLDRGGSWQAPVVVHRDGTMTEHGFVSMVPAGEDRVRVFWIDGRNMAASAGDHAHGGADEHMTLRTAVLARDGEPRDEVELDELTCACCQTDAVRSQGTTRVAYRNRTAGEERDIGLVTLSAGEWSAPQLLHPDGWVIAACPVNGPALATDGTRHATLWPTMADGEMRVQLSLEFRAPTVLARGAAELGRVDIAAWPTGWLATRVAATDRVPTLWLSDVDGEGRAVGEHAIAARVGGYPRIASNDGVALLAWAEQGDTPGASRVGLVRISPATVQE